jgi:hypothetical protein
VAVSGTGQADGLVRVTSDDGVDATYPTEVDGEIILGPVFALIPSNVPCTQVCATADQTPDGADCESCAAFAGMGWKDSGNHEQVRAVSNYNEATEVIDKQNNHAALIMGSGKCFTDSAYGGELKWSAFSGDLSGWAAGPNLESGYYSGSNKTWTVAGGHHWEDGGNQWDINAGPDTCRKF